MPVLKPAKRADLHRQLADAYEAAAHRHEVDLVGIADPSHRERIGRLISSELRSAAVHRRRAAAAASAQGRDQDLRGA